MQALRLPCQMSNVYGKTYMSTSMRQRGVSVYGEISGCLGLISGWPPAGTGTGENARKTERASRAGAPTIRSSHRTIHRTIIEQS